MMTSRHGNDFHITSPLHAESFDVFLLLALSCWTKSQGAVLFNSNLCLLFLVAVVTGVRPCLPDITCHDNLLQWRHGWRSDFRQFVRSLGPKTFHSAYDVSSHHCRNGPRICPQLYIVCVAQICAGHFNAGKFLLLSIHMFSHFYPWDAFCVDGYCHRSVSLSVC